MNPEKKKAARILANATKAATVKEQNELYRNADLLSILKIKIGERLLFDNPNWHKIESALRKYYEVQA